ncbi:hypothetical protein FOA52_008410 [Chlamydomonas sp. UWO 241]|nr:hypothetical protein FOA52_008410 [Chlamydomonas sp. UWO 241]
MALYLPLLLLACATAMRAGCPVGYGGGSAGGVPRDVDVGMRRALLAEKDGSPVADFKAVSVDILALMTDSQDFWPADFGSYAGLFIRHAWHCSGSYRASDGRGGCDGGRQRFNPERAWPDNGNLDKPKRLLEPIKLKYGSSLSWGDLIILAGNIAIESGGGPTLGFCGGRIVDADGTASLELGRSLEQEQIAPCPVQLGRQLEQEQAAPCPVQGDCKWPLGPSVITNIYVDPSGFMGNPDPGNATAQDIRDVFSRMNFNDSETVALVGGGHSFGKMHGACNASLGGPGPGPDANPFMPWAGSCGEPGDMFGKGVNTFTSGYDWTNDYFTSLLEYEWILTNAPSGNPQWAATQKEGGRVPPANIHMLTTDVANLFDARLMVALERAGMPQVPFCGGRSDALDDDGGVHVRDWYPDPFVAFRDNMRVMGLDVSEAVALMGRLRSPTQQARLHYTGSYTNESATFSNDYFNYLLTADWQGWVSKNESTDAWQYNREGTSGDMVMNSDDLVILYNTTWRAVAQEFAADDAKFKSTFASAWSKLMNADRFKGPAGNLLRRRKRHLWRGDRALNRPRRRRLIWPCCGHAFGLAMCHGC